MNGYRSAEGRALGDPGRGLARGVEVTVFFEGEALQTRQLAQDLGSKKTSWVALVGGASAVAAGLVFALLGQAGAAGLLALVGLALVPYAVARLREARAASVFIIGDGVDADLPMAHASLPAERFVLVRYDDRGYQLLLTPEMEGEVVLDGRCFRPADLLESGIAYQLGEPSGVYGLPLTPDAGAHLCFGRHAISVRAVQPERHPLVTSTLSRVDWSAQAHHGLSCVGHALILALVFAVPPQPKAVSLDLFDDDRSMSPYQVQPLQPQPLIEPSRPGDEGAGRQGKPHAGKQGKMGREHVRGKPKRYELKRQPDASPQLAAELARRSAQSAGILGQLGERGGILNSPFGGDRAIGEEAEEALGNLMGDEPGEAPGYGGLGVVGYGRNGGGTEPGEHVGVGPWGKIGHTRRRDGPRWGVGEPRGPERKAGAPEVGHGRVRLEGALDRALIRSVVRRHLNEVKFCYQKELQSDPSLGGRVVISFTIAPTGQVIRSLVEDSTTRNATVDACIAKAVRRWLFPKPHEGGIVHVSYPFVLHAAGTPAS